MGFSSLDIEQWWSKVKECNCMNYTKTITCEKQQDNKLL